MAGWLAQKQKMHRMANIKNNPFFFEASTKYFLTLLFHPTRSSSFTWAGMGKIVSWSQFFHELFLTGQSGSLPQKSIITGISANVPAGNCPIYRVPIKTAVMGILHLLWFLCVHGHNGGHLVLYPSMFCFMAPFHPRSIILRQ